MMKFSRKPLEEQPDCDCRFCVSARRFRQWSRNDRALAEARATGDEVWYGRLLQERGALQLSKEEKRE